MRNWTHRTVVFVQKLHLFLGQEAQLPQTSTTTRYTQHLPVSALASTEKTRELNAVPKNIQRCKIYGRW